MYDNVIYMGKTLKEWSKELKNEFTLGELYRMMQNGDDFKALSSVRLSEHSA